MSKKSTKQSRTTALRKANQAARRRHDRLLARAIELGVWGCRGMSDERLEHAVRHARLRFNPFEIGQSMSMAAATMLIDLNKG